MSSEWYKTGDEGYKQVQKIQEERQKEYGPRRFFLKPNTSAKVTFLDSNGFYFHEHELQIDGKWGHYFTCRRDFDECPLCDAGISVSYGCAYTVIDHSEYQTKSGGSIKNQKKLLVIKPTVVNKLARKRENEQLKGNLTGAVFLFTRDKKEECRTGEDLEFIKKLSQKDLIKFKPKDSKESDADWIKPFDYLALFAPKSVEELRKISGQAPPVGSDDYQGAVAGVTGGSQEYSEDNIEDLL
ncbi:MAG: hypothetical protein LBQ51_02375 [Desulfovibrio sp.]|jgi:urease gamma subunit|nr:hypothetical protein [Desulfovibrio sp.]